MHKKRGGQLGNKNAYKHGFYSKYFNAFESKALSEIPLTDMTGEIGLMRVNVDRFMQAYTTSLEKLDYAERLAGLRAITLAVGRIVSLERIRTGTDKKIEQDNEFLKSLENMPMDDIDADQDLK
jgi:hypothetical protein